MATIQTNSDWLTHLVRHLFFWQKRITHVLAHRLETQHQEDQPKLRFILFLCLSGFVSSAYFYHNINAKLILNIQYFTSFSRFFSWLRNSGHMHHSIFITYFRSCLLLAFIVPLFANQISWFWNTEHKVYHLICLFFRFSPWIAAVPRK